MTIAHDATTALGNGTGTLSATHTPVGTPKGAFVLIAQNVGQTNEVTSVTYGGVAMTLAKFDSTNTAEPGASYVYHLGSGIPTGAQTVSVSVNGTASTKVARVQTVTAAADTAVATTGSSTGSQANPAVALTLESYRNAYAVGALYSGVSDVATIAPNSGYTDLAEHDFGSMAASFIRIDAEDAGGGMTVGWTVASDDTCAVAVAIEEVVTLTNSGSPATLSGSPVSGAKILIMYAKDNTLAEPSAAYQIVTTNGSGIFSALIPKSAKGFAFPMLNVSGTLYTAPARPFLN